MHYPAGAWSDGTRLAVVDDSNDRILVWSTFPTQSFQPADIVLGQGDFTHDAPNDVDQDGSDDGVPSAATLNDPYKGVWSNGLQLLAVDASNHRLLVWDSFPAQSFQAADHVVGQVDFAHGAPNDDDQDGASDATPSARTLGYPNGLAVHGDEVLITDSDNNRVLLFKAM